MKNIIVISVRKVLLCTLAMLWCSVVTNAQTWTNVGQPDFTPGSAGPLSLAIDPTGIPYVAFIDYSTNQNGVTVMSFDGNTWKPVGMPAFSAGSATNVNLAVDGNGIPYVVYIDAANQGLLTAMVYVNGSWMVVGNPGFSPGPAQYPSIAIDGAGTPFVAFQDLTSPNAGVTVMKFDGKNWVPVGSTGFSTNGVQFTSIAIDNGGVPYVAYQDMGDNGKGGATVMTYNDSSGWVTIGTPGFSGGPANSPSLTVDGSGTLYIAYQDCVNGCMATVMSYNYTDSSWEPIGKPGFSQGPAQNTAIAIGSGIPYVVFQDASVNNAATVMQYGDAGWVPVGKPGISQGPAGSPVIAAYSGGPYIGYTDLSTHNLGTVTLYGPITPYSPTCGILYFYDATGNRIYRTDTCIDNAPVSKTTSGGVNSTANHSQAQTILSNSNSTITANVYPNPTQGTVNITVSQPLSDANVSLLDVNGAVIKKMNMTGSISSLDLSGFASGTYLVEIQSTTAHFIFKVQKL